MLDSAADSYIAEGLRAMGSLNATVLLRIGAEMNNWSSIDSATYIQAFQKIAAQAHQYSNIKTVFSPATISDRNHTISEFYPGDQYVDWVGVSDYQNSAYAGQAPAYTFDAAAYGNDAYYGRGLYSSDPLTLVLAHCRLAQQHNKPLMISECGFSYTSAAGGDQTAYAARPAEQALFLCQHDLPPRPRPCSISTRICPAPPITMPCPAAPPWPAPMRAPSRPTAPI